MNNLTAVVDYGVGNLKSIENAMSYLGFRSCITSDPHEIAHADSIILPGVGAFPNAANKLRHLGLDQVISTAAKRKPVLGICLGMQLLFSRGEEVSPCEGLDLVSGSVQMIPTEEKLPHIGWNRLNFPVQSPLFSGIDTGAHVYFVHSYCGVAACAEDVIAYTDYGGPVVAAVGKGNVYGCQFHPEKSGEVGLQILKNFGELNT